MPKNMVNPSNGRIIVVDDADVGLYEKMGYSQESFEAGVDRSVQEDNERFYTSTDQIIETGLEGAVSGATLGLSDLVFGNDGTSQRAAYNPGARMVGELVGAIGGAKIPFSPAAKAAGLGERAGAAVGIGTRARAVALGVEGAIQGAGASAAYAKLSGDPLTAESVASGAGLGFFMGAGLGALGKGLEGKAASIVTDSRDAKQTATRLAEIDADLAARRLARAEEKAARAEARARRVESGSSTYEVVVPEHRYSSVRAGLEEAASDLAAASDQVDETMAVVTDDKYLGLAKAETQRVTREFTQMAPEVREQFSTEFQKLSSTIKSLERDPGNVGRILAHEKALGAAAEAVGVSVQLPQSYSSAAQRVMDQAHQAWEISKVLDDLPSDLEDMARMTAPEIKTMSEAIESAGKLSSQVGPRVQKAVGAVDDLLKEAGFGGSEPLVERMTAFRDALRKSSPEVLDAQHSAARAVRAQEEAVLKAERAQLRREAVNKTEVAGLLNKALEWGAGVKGAQIGRGMGGPWAAAAGFGIGRMAARAILGAKGAVLNRINGSIAKFGGPAGRALQKVAPVAPWALFSVSLTGDTPDDKLPKDAVRAAMIRMEELSSLAPHVEDVALSAVAPFRGDHPDLAAQLAKGLTTAVKYLQQVMPRDPGTVVMRGVSVWNPSPVQARDFGERWHTVMNPVVALGNFLSGALSPVAVHAFAGAWPHLYEYARSRTLRELPGVLPTMNKAQRTQASWLLGVGLDGSQAPSFVRFLQQNLASAPLQGSGAPPGPGRSPVGGRPPGPDESALTAAERTLEHF